MPHRVLRKSGPIVREIYGPANYTRRRTRVSGQTDDTKFPGGDTRTRCRTNILEILNIIWNAYLDMKYLIKFKQRFKQFDFFNRGHTIVPLTTQKYTVSD